MFRGLECTCMDKVYKLLERGKWGLPVGWGLRQRAVDLGSKAMRKTCQ